VRKRSVLNKGEAQTWDNNRSLTVAALIKRSPW